MDTIIYHPIGIIHSPFKETAGMPVQAAAAQGIAGTIELDPALLEGLHDLDGFSHLILLYHFHLVKRMSLRVTPFLDDQPHGVLATRAPARPNSIGLSIVRLMRVEGPTLYIEDVDIVDGTPLLDIKPYVPDFDVRTDVRIGWLAKNIARMHNTHADDRMT